MQETEEIKKEKGLRDFIVCIVAGEYIYVPSELEQKEKDED